MSRRKPIIGLCGGIGAGKSTVAAELARLGCLVIDSDALNDEVLNDPAVIQTLRAWWGDQVVGPDGTLDRRQVARIVFDDPEQRRRLESLVHPLIARRREDMIADGIKDPAVKAIVLDSPLLLECQLDRLCDSIVYVEADEAQRLERVARTRGWDAEELARREACQMSLSEKRRRADHVIRNDADRQVLRERAASVLERILTQTSADETQR